MHWRGMCSKLGCWPDPRHMFWTFPPAAMIGPYSVEIMHVAFALWVWTSCACDMLRLPVVSTNRPRRGPNISPVFLRTLLIYFGIKHGERGCAQGPSVMTASLAGLAGDLRELACPALNHLESPSSAPRLQAWRVDLVAQMLSPEFEDGLPSDEESRVLWMLTSSISPESSFNSTGTFGFQ